MRNIFRRAIDEQIEPESPISFGGAEECQHQSVIVKQRTSPSLWEMWLFCEKCKTIRKEEVRRA